MKAKSTSLRKNETGVVSIIVVMLIMIILTLIVLAMSRDANREQRQSLDRQLSSQAFYASESGINDTVNYIRTHLADPTLVTEKQSCDVSPISQNAGNPGQVGDDPVIKYTCILYNLNPTTLEFGNVTSDSATVSPLQNSNSTGIDTITISWDDDSGGTTFTGCPAVPELPSSSAYTNCDAGMIKIELIDANTLKRADLINNDFNAFIFASNGAANPASRSGNTGANQGVFATANCSGAGTPKKCNATITNVGLSGSGQLFMRLRTLYKPKSSVIVGGVDSVGNPVKFKNAQIMVDSTGKANDVLRRLQVRVPVIPKFNEEESAIRTTGDLCKLLNVYPGQTNPAEVNSCN